MCGSWYRRMLFIRHCCWHSLLMTICDRLSRVVLICIKFLNLIWYSVEVKIRNENEWLVFSRVRNFNWTLTPTELRTRFKQKNCRGQNEENEELGSVFASNILAIQKKNWNIPLKSAVLPKYHWHGESDFIQFSHPNSSEPPRQIRIFLTFGFGWGRIWCAWGLVDVGAEKSTLLKTLLFSNDKLGHVWILLCCFFLEVK